MLDDKELQQKPHAELLEIIKQQQDKIINQDSLITQLHDALKLNRHQRFGKNSERDTDAVQLDIFNEAEVTLESQPVANESDEQTITVPEHQRKKGRNKLPKDLKRVEIVYDLNDADKHCPCGCTMVCIGDERSEQLDIIPAKAQVLVHIRKKYACQGCQKNIKQAELPKQPIPKSLASANTLAHVLVAKFQDALPLYRQESIFRRTGIDLPRSTLSNWVIRSAQLLKPLVNLLQSNLLDYDVAYADETRVQVLHEPGREAKQRSYMWLFAGGRPDQFGLVYRYAPSRAQVVPNTFLGDFKGYLHCDGYQSYDSLAKQRDVTLVGCWYHVRRKFFEASKVSSRAGLAKQAIQLIKKLSDIERDIKKIKANADKIRDIRQLRAKPILNKFKTWLDEKSLVIAPSSLIGIAINYTLRQWPKLLIYLEDGRLELSNNLAERAIKPFVMGRKNWLFAHSVRGADSAAIIYSLIETCKAHDMEPFNYL